jgi:hypothetical protein
MDNLIMYTEKEGWENTLTFTGLVDTRSELKLILSDMKFHEKGGCSYAMVARKSMFAM